jgi:hypothetical protein
MDRQDAICGPRNGATNTEALSDGARVAPSFNAHRCREVDGANPQSSLYVSLLRKIFEKGQLCIRFCLTFA